MPRKHTPRIHTPFSLESGVVSCRKKQRFFNQTAAERAAELKNLEDTTLHISTYHCDVCHKWHLTSKR